ncbi:DNA cytosine methyltransferase [Tropicimonas sp. S265A]|uniref:DNA cytosine methyltransferase n=1 Tax=Tropicimonas sp. S265A TaxID=3415134 RepID=UPI003C7E42F3
MALFSTERHEDIRGLSLCSGVGGLDLGLHIAMPGYRTVCFVERNSFAAATLVARMADKALAPAPVWDDLRSFDGRAWRGKVHIISAGYPCQPFTLSGLRAGDSDPRHLWPDVRRIVEEAQPPICFFENVPGHLTLGLSDVVGDLQRLGYRVAARVVSAAEVGGSHTRERLFILAYSDLQGVGQQSVHSHEPRRPAVLHGSEPDWLTGRDQERSFCLDADVGFDGCSGLEAGTTDLFPALPGDLVEWGEALRRSPELKPCVQRPPHGVATWLERTAAAGNGVVPVAAARAFLDLTEALIAR